MYSNARLYSRMEDKISKGGNYKRFKKGSKWEYSNLGPENFVHSPFKISGSAPAHPFGRKVWRVERVIILFCYFNCNSIIYIFVFISFVTFIILILSVSFYDSNIRLYNKL